MWIAVNNSSNSCNIHHGPAKMYLYFRKYKANINRKISRTTNTIVFNNLFFEYHQSLPEVYFLLQ